MTVRPEKQAAIDRVKAQIDAAQIDEGSKDQLAALVAEASDAANGTADKIGAMSNVLLMVALALARHEATSPSRLEAAADAALARHVEKCPVQAPSTGLPRVLACLYPFRWPLVALAAIPGGLPIVQDILGIAGRAMGG